MRCCDAVIVGDDMPPELGLDLASRRHALTQYSILRHCRVVPCMYSLEPCSALYAQQAYTNAKGSYPRFLSWVTRYTANSVIQLFRLGRVQPRTRNDADTPKR